MKSSRRQVRCKAHALPALKFENQSLTSFAGLVVLQQFFTIIRLKVRLARCFAHQAAGKVFSRPILFLQLILHLLLGYRELRESRYYQDDPLVKRLLGLRTIAGRGHAQPHAQGSRRQEHRQSSPASAGPALPTVGAIGPAANHPGLRRLGAVHDAARGRNGRRLQQEEERGPQLLSVVLHASPRPAKSSISCTARGNVHDSHGAQEFILACVQAVREPCRA